MKRKSTKRALATSVLSTCACVTMLAGATFAWFTDTASTSVNKIQAGKLDIALLDTEGNSVEGGNLEWNTADGREQADILWEPGATYELEEVTVKNNGNLAAKYKVIITGIDGDAELNEAIDWKIDGADMDKEYKLAAGASEKITITGTMKRTAGNEYQGKSIDGIGITVVATQDSVESDSFDNQYDKDADHDAVFVSSYKEINEAIKAGKKVLDANGTNFGDFYYDVKFPDGTILKNAKFTYFYGGNVTGTVTFDNCEFVSDHSYSANFDSGNGKIIFNNCLFDGWSSFGTAITNVEMNNCTFQKSYKYGILRFYQTAQLDNCTFEDSFEGVDTNVTGQKVEFDNCTGIDGKIFNNGSNKGTWIVNGTDISDTVTSW